MDANKKQSTPDFKGLRHSKIGYFKEVRSKIKELENLNIQLARRHNRLDAIFNSMSDAVTIIDRNLNIIFTNRVQAKMFPEASDPGMTCHQLFYQRDRQCPDCPASKTRETGETLRGEHMFKKGRPAGRYFEWTTSPIADAAGNVDEIILIMRDITERKEKDFKMMQTDRMVSVGFLATSLAHEINNPLASIAGFSEGLLKRVQTHDLFRNEKVSASFREYLEIINIEAYRCRDIIQNLREFSRCTSDNFSSVHIDQIINDTIALIRQHAKDHHIKIVFENHMVAGFNAMYGKSGQLKHLFMNLFKQLFTSLTEGGELKIIARNDAEKIEISLVDPDGSLTDHIPGCLTYQRFDDPAFDGQERMDLSICYSIIRQHRGDLRSVSSNNGDRLLVMCFPVLT